MSEIIQKVVKKAEILTLLDQPKVPFQSEKDPDQPVRTSRSMRSISHVTEDVYDLDQNILSAKDRKNLIEEASTSSVLACLQTPIEAE